MKTSIHFLLTITLLSITEISGANSRDITVQSAQQFQQQDKVVIAVGISNYNTRDSGFSRLNYASKDARVLANTLRGKGYASTITVLDHDANKQNILNKIRQEGKTFRNGQGTLIFSFSGHGYNEGGISYLATYDSRATDLQSSGLKIQEVVHAIRQTGVKRAILLIDACRNDPTPGMKSAGRKALGGINPGSGIQILYSTRFSDVSWEHDNIQQGVFSYFVNEALNGEALENGIVTFSRLANYVERQVFNWTKNRFPQAQQPYSTVAGEKYGDFVLVSKTSQKNNTELEKRTDRYIDHGDGTVTDTKTNLMWKKCSEGQSGKYCSNGDAKQYTWNDAMQHAEAHIFAGYHDWRIPSINELNTLIHCNNGVPQEVAWEHSCSNEGKANGGKPGVNFESPTIDQSTFLNAAIGFPWSSSKKGKTSALVGEFFFGQGNQSLYYLLETPTIVRLVRNKN